MLTPSSIGKLLRRLHSRFSINPVPEELRGWSWWRPPLRPRGFFGLGVSEVAYRYCPTRRDLWLRRISGVQPRPSSVMIRGRIVHDVFRASARDTARLFLSGSKPEDIIVELSSSAESRLESIFREYSDGFIDLGLKLYKRLVFLWAGWIEETGQPPWYVEYSVDGSMLGLSPRLRVDGLGIGFVVEVKYGSWRSDYPVGVAGYALALEASHEIPIDYGLVVLVNNDGSRIDIEPVYIGEDYRAEFIAYRDEAIEIILSENDPGRPVKCSDNCPFYSTCWGGV